VLIVDTETRAVRTVAALSPRHADKVSVARDGRRVFVAVTSTESDVWVRSSR
jgi:hypothetical protein